MNMFELGFAAENTRQPIPRLGLLLQGFKGPAQIGVKISFKGFSGCRPG
jgi:hypothetical protein